VTWRVMSVMPYAEAPRSMLEGSEYQSLSAEQFGFKPTLGTVPTMSFPSMLPNLPMVGLNPKPEP